jgi:hypothetical protein
LYESWKAIQIDRVLKTFSGKAFPVGEVIEVKDNELVLLAVGGYFIWKGINKLPSLATQAAETAYVDVGNVPVGTSNLIIKNIYDFLTPSSPLNGNYSYIDTEGGIKSWLQNPPSSTFVKNEWGEGTGFFTNTADALPPNTYTGLNEWGEGTAILTDTHPIASSDWIAGFHLW